MSVLRDPVNGVEDVKGANGPQTGLNNSGVAGNRQGNLSTP